MNAQQQAAAARAIAFLEHIEIPEANPVQRRIQALRRQQQILITFAQRRAADIEAEIQRLENAQ